MCGASRPTVISQLNACLAESAGTPDACVQTAYTILLAVHKRDIDDGSGERTLSYWMFLELFHKYPNTMEKILPVWIEKYGSWLDLNKMSCIIAEDLKQSQEPVKSSLQSLQNIIVQLYVDALNQD